MPLDRSVPQTAIAVREQVLAVDFQNLLSGPVGLLEEMLDPGAFNHSRQSIIRAVRGGFVRLMAIYTNIYL